MTGTRLDRWHGAYSRRASGMTASQIRALFAVASRPEVVSLAGGMPTLDALPLPEVAEIVRRCAADSAAEALQYGSGQGDILAREQIVDVMTTVGVTCDPDDVVVTTGSQHALDLLVRVLVDPGDVVLVETPSYVGALGVLRSYEADVRHVPVDAEGVDPVALEAVVVGERAAGRRVKALYVVPHHQNPGGTTTSARRRAALVEVCRRLEVLVVEDDPYALLGFDHDPLPAMHSLDPDGVVYLGSFSKTFAPGLRVGWAVAPPALRSKLVLAAEAAVLCPSSFSQRVVATYLATSDWRAHVKVLRSVYRERRDALVGALEQHLPDAVLTRPDGGFFTWVAMPDDLDTTAMLPRAVAARVAYVPGTAFHADGGGGAHMRLSFCFPPPERIAEGVRRLAGVVAGERELRRTFRGTGPVPVAVPTGDVDRPATDTA
ncbi:PLP-dependent aminotransferase family protein [Aquipuribacter nitratireducens]|uniref:PLP-dependent aminotransferase family protein n=1 Tax=Aquipuribacter nitratireducens TaxID=650104 RepID=A0ABW0GMR5_9MICO